MDGEENINTAPAVIYSTHMEHKHTALSNNKEGLEHFWTENGIRLSGAWPYIKTI